MALDLSRLVAPFRDKVLSDDGFFTRPWESFLSLVNEVCDSYGREKTFQLANNQASAANIEELSFNYQKNSQAIVEYLIQRVTTGGGATQLIESGIFLLVYKPTSNTWSKVSVGTPGPDASGVTLTVTSAGQVQYVSTNITGTASISKIVYRARTMKAKSSTYSTVGDGGGR